MPGQYVGIYRGVVTNAADPQMSGRVQVSVPAVTGGVSMWAAVCRPVGASTPSVGSTSAVGRNVWVMFENGDPSRPVVMGIS